MKIFKWLLILLSICLWLVNCGLYHYRTIESQWSCKNDTCLNQTVYAQLTHLSEVLHNQDGAMAMQQLYPEGFMFTNALYGLAWCDFVRHLPASELVKKEAEIEILFSMRAMESSQGYGVFPKNLPLEYGAFYRGWLAYLKAKYIQSFGVQNVDSSLIVSYSYDCKKISDAFLNSNKPYLESYNGLSWPADNIVCLASLALHDNLFTPAYSHSISSCLDRIKSTLLPDIQLIPHQYDINQDIPLEGARGSSQALMLCFLPEIDSLFAKDQYFRFKQNFISCLIDMPGVLEHPKGYYGTSDIDSGPIIMGYGGSATITAIKAAIANQDFDQFYAIKSGVELVLLSKINSSKKQYLFGRIPIVDAFMAWACSAENDKKYVKNKDYGMNLQNLMLFFSILLSIFSAWFFRKF